MKALALALLVGGCSERVDLLPTRAATAACTAPGPPIKLGRDAPCAAALAASHLRYALCSCSSLVLPEGLFTQGGMPMREPSFMTPPAAVGTDGSLQVSGLTQVAGTVEAAGPAGASFGRTAAVLGKLRSGGAVSAARSLSVGGDAYAAGDVLGRIDVGGTLHAPRGAFIAPSVLAGALVREPVSVPAPCGCGAGPAVDVEALVSGHATVNDDARIALDPEAYAAGTGAPQLDLDCGEFYLSSLHTPAGVDLDVRVHGRAALFVGGDVALGGDLHVSLDPMAELDLVIAGKLTAQTGVIGGPAAASVRIWMGAAPVQLGSGASLSAALYAPASTLVSDSDLVAAGALLAAGFTVVGDVSVRFDPRILGAGAACGAALEPPVQ
jgi:hypothetical protein